MHTPILKEIGRRGSREFGASIGCQLIGDAKGGEGLPQYTDLVSCPDPTHSNEEKGLVLFEQFLGFADLA